jgi:hypothetical protein
MKKFKPLETKEVPVRESAGEEGRALGSGPYGSENGGFELSAMLARAPTADE